MKQACARPIDVLWTYSSSSVAVAGNSFACTYVLHLAIARLVRARCSKWTKYFQSICHLFERATPRLAPNGRNCSETGRRSTTSQYAADEDPSTTPPARGSSNTRHTKGPPARVRNKEEASSACSVHEIAEINSLLPIPEMLCQASVVKAFF